MENVTCLVVANRCTPPEMQRRLNNRRLKTAQWLKTAQKNFTTCFARLRLKNLFNFIFFYFTENQAAAFYMAKILMFNYV